MDLIQLIRVDERLMTCVEGREMQSADTNQIVLPSPPPLPFFFFRVLFTCAIFCSVIMALCEAQARSHFVLLWIDMLQLRWHVIVLDQVDQ